MSTEVLRPVYSSGALIGMHVQPTYEPSTETILDTDLYTLVNESEADDDGSYINISVG
jgi:hypothetical protein